jgi:hypothetical protein
MIVVLTAALILPAVLAVLFGIATKKGRMNTTRPQTNERPHQ